MTSHWLVRSLLHWRTWFRLVTLVIAVFIIWATLTPSGRTYAKAFLFVPSLIHDSPVRPINLFTKTPERVAVTFSDADTAWGGDLYLPATSPPHPAIIVSLGVSPAGRNDKRVVRLGEGLARMGIVTLVPYSQNLVNKTLTRREIDFTVEAFRYLERHPAVAPEKIGYLGVCVGSSLALLAAQDQRISDRVNFVSWFGGYYQLEDLLVSVATKSYGQDGQRVAWNPDQLTREVAVRRSVRFADEADWGTLEPAILHRWDLTEEQLSALSPTGRLVHQFFRQTDPERAYAILDQMPPEAQGVFRVLSPATNLDRLRTRVFVMDDIGDELIPYVHSRRLAEALEGTGLARHSKFSVFSHADLDELANPVNSVPELWSLYLHIHAIFDSIL